MAENDQVPATDDTAPAENEDVLNKPEDGEGAAPDDAQGQDKPADEAEDEDANGILTPEADDKGGEGKDSPAGAPEQYADFKLPEGFTLDEDDKAAMTGMFRELNLSQAAGQKLVDAFVERTTAQKEAMLNELSEKRKQWRAELRSRPNFAAERALARKGMNAVVSKEQRALFTDTWLSDHPVLFDIFVKVGGLLGEDAPLPTGGGVKKDPILDRFPIKAR